MNMLKSKNQLLRDAILEGDLEKSRKLLTTKFGKADATAVTENGGYSMLHCAALAGDTQIIMMLIQFGADVMRLTDDGYSALDLAIWKGHQEAIEWLRLQGCIAPIKEPESLNGKIILHNGKKATVVDLWESNTPRKHKMRGIHYETGENLMVDLWAGSDYKILGDDRNISILKRLDFQMDSMLTEDDEYSNLLNGEAFIDNDSDSEDENELEDIIEIRVPPGPLGINLDSGIQDRAVVYGFSSQANGQKGAIELHGGVVPGMYIIGINDINASLMSLQQVIKTLGKLSRKEKIIRFAKHNPNTISTEAESSSNPTADESTTSVETNRLTSSSYKERASEHIPPPSPQVIQSTDEMDEEIGECIHCGLPLTVHKSEDCPYQ